MSKTRLLLTNTDNTVWRADQQYIGSAIGKNAIADHAGDIVYATLQRRWVVDMQSVNIKNDISVIRDYPLSPDCVATQLVLSIPHQGSGHGNNFNR